MVARSQQMLSVFAFIERLARYPTTALVTGESGTGKELVARALHNLSPLRDRPFVVCNCTTLAPTLLESELFGYVRGAFTGAATSKRGKFALAHGGSIFLDEIGTMNVGVQAKLLRVLQEREIEPLGAERAERVDVRVIAATNRDLRQLVREGRFLDDLFYRLYVVPIPVPPLRERIDDIPMLMDHFIDKHATRNGRVIEAVEDGIVEWLQKHRWPGNVRELENTIERAVVLSGSPRIRREVVTMEVGIETVAAAVPSLKLRQNVEWVERETIRRALEVSPLKQHAARLMGISPRALSHYLAKYPFIAEGAPPSRQS
jgi:transcriptional regulator with GAF, ATPase, and Fis domain